MSANRSFFRAAYDRLVDFRMRQAERAIDAHRANVGDDWSSRHMRRPID